MCFSGGAPQPYAPAANIPHAKKKKAEPWMVAAVMENRQRRRMRPSTSSSPPSGLEAPALGTQTLGGT